MYTVLIFLQSSPAEPYAQKRFEHELIIIQFISFVVTTLHSNNCWSSKAALVLAVEKLVAHL